MDIRETRLGMDWIHLAQNSSAIVGFSRRTWRHGVSYGVPSKKYVSTRGMDNTEDLSNRKVLSYFTVLYLHIADVIMSFVEVMMQQVEYIWD
jgi:hypothetical protein